MDTHSLQVPRIALLIDFDNVILGVEEPPGFDIELVVKALRSRGNVVLGRAYGDWYRHNRHRRKLMEHGIELVETPAFGPIIKNSADIRIALDGFEIGMTQHHITEFCLVSGDSDFLPLIKRLQYLGKTVTVISGVKFTSELVRRNCNEFISYENLLAESVGATEDATTLEGSFTLLTRTINTLHERNMEVRSSTVKQMMIQLNPVFSERTFGCSQFKQFLDKACRAGLIKLGSRDPNSGEYNVLLPNDVEEELVINEEAPKPARPARRIRGRRAQATEEEATAQAPVAAEGAEEVAAASEETSADAPARAGSRIGRLRSSGRTWKSGKAVTRSILQGALNGAAPASESQDEPQAELETAPQAQEEEAPAAQLPLDIPEAPVSEIPAETQAAEAVTEASPEETPAEVEEAPAEKPKRAPRRRKPAAKKKAEAKPEGDEANSDGAQEAPVAPAAEEATQATMEAPAAEAVTDAAPAEAAEPEAKEEKKAAKKPARRRAPRKKKEESAAPQETQES